MDPKKLRRERHKSQYAKLKNIIDERPDAKLVENKYKVVAGVLRRWYPELQAMDPEYVAKIADDAIALNREWQFRTEGSDKENKDRLQEEWLGENYGKGSSIKNNE